jgi:hypothetical protein
MFWKNLMPPSTGDKSMMHGEVRYRHKKEEQEVSHWKVLIRTKEFYGSKMGQ